MENTIIIANIVGFIAFLISTLKYQAKCGKRIVWIEAPNTLLWALHMLLLGGYQAAMVNTISAARTYLSIKYRPDLSKYFLITSIVLACIILIPSIEKGFQILPLIAFSLYGTTLVVQDNSRHVRLFYFASDTVWLSYAVILGSIPLMATCALSMLSAMIGFYRHEKDSIMAFITGNTPRTYP